MSDALYFGSFGDQFNWLSLNGNETCTDRWCGWPEFTYSNPNSKFLRIILFVLLSVRKIWATCLSLSLIWTSLPWAIKILFSLSFAVYNIWRSWQKTNVGHLNPWCIYLIKYITDFILLHSLDLVPLISFLSFWHIAILLVLSKVWIS